MNRFAQRCSDKIGIYKQYEFTKVLKKKRYFSLFYFLLYSFYSNNYYLKLDMELHLLLESSSHRTKITRVGVKYGYHF